MSTGQEKEHQTKIVELIREAIERDIALREKYQVTEKFRFIRERLQALLTQVESELASTVESEKKGIHLLAADEVLVYVYLFNAKGALLRDWKNMVLPNVFYEYSVNRPIYFEKSQIEAFIRAKTNKNQHAYLTVAIKKSDLSTTSSKDSMGNALLKVKENSLVFKNLMSFTHNWIDYEVNEEGAFVKK